MKNQAPVPQFRTPYTPWEDHSIDCGEVSLTKQSDMDSCDINKILAKYEKTGILPDMIKENPQYGDFSNPIDYQESLNIVIHAQEQFDALPALVRRRFDNDAAKFLAFASDERNLEEMGELGLLNPEATTRLAEAKKARLEREEDERVAARKGKATPASEGSAKPKSDS